MILAMVSEIVLGLGVVLPCLHLVITSAMVQEVMNFMKRVLLVVLIVQVFLALNACQGITCRMENAILALLLFAYLVPEVVAHNATLDIICLTDLVQHPAVAVIILTLLLAAVILALLGVPLVLVLLFAPAVLLDILY